MHPRLVELAGPEVAARPHRLGVVEVRVGRDHDPEPASLAEQGVPQAAEDGGHLVEATQGLRPRGPVGAAVDHGVLVGEGRRLVARRALHAAVHVGREVVVLAELPRLVAAVVADRRRRTGGMVREQDRQPLEPLHVGQRLPPERRRLPPRVGGQGPVLVGVEPPLDLVEHLRLVLRPRDDERVVVHARHVELQAVELQHVGHELARQGQLAVRLLEVQLGVVRAAVVGRHHPPQAELPRHRRVPRRRVEGVPRLDRRRRTRAVVVAGAPVAVDVRVAGQPLALVGGRRGQREGGHGGQHAGPGDARRHGSRRRHRARFYHRLGRARPPAPPPCGATSHAGGINPALR